MTFDKMFRIENILEVEEKVRAYVNYYSSLKINGMHYVDFNGKKNILHISKPNHEMHYEATCFLLRMKYNNGRINTISRIAYDLKKFLDFIMLWNLDLINSDLFHVMVSFATYLRLLKHQRMYPSIEWALVKNVPLHDKALFHTKLLAIGYDDKGFMGKEPFEDLDIRTISATIGTALRYLEFLRDNTYKYQGLDLSEIPIKVVKMTTKLTGTLKTQKVQIAYDEKSIMVEAGIDSRAMSSERIKPLTDEIFSIEEMDLFMSAIPQSNAQSRLMFHILKCFGLRRAELCNLMINSSSIPIDIHLWDINDAKKWIKENMEGDIEFDPKLNKWVCHVFWRATPYFQCQHKTGNRDIPLMFPQEDFTSLLLEHIQERQTILESSQSSHDYLFLSYSNNSKGKPITGGTVYSTYNRIIENSGYVDTFSKYSPHTFRHFFATYLLRVKNYSISDISDWLGHSRETITRKVYVHYLNQPSDDKGSSMTEDMVDTFGRNKASQ